MTGKGGRPQFASDETARRNWERTFLPRPGTPEAIDLGCTCPVLDNAFGRGYLGNGLRYGWVYNVDCAVHGGGE